MAEIYGAEQQFRFLMQVLQSILNSGADAQAIYPLLRQNIVLLNDEMIEILVLASANFSEMDRVSQKKLTLVMVDFGNLIQDFKEGSKAVNMELSLHCYRLALEVFTITEDPQNWGFIQNNFASAYLKRIEGDRAENIEKSIQRYESLLEVRTKVDLPIEWALTQNNLANAYGERIRGDRAENIEKSIQYYELALEVRTKAVLPIDWALTQNNLASSYLYRIEGDRAENIEKSIQCYELALEVRTKAALPTDWALTQHNLAGAYLNRIAGHRAENIEKSIHCCELALEVRTKVDSPTDWACTKNDLGNAYLNRIRGDHAENIENSIKCYEEALEVRTTAELLIDWAATQHNLGGAYLNRIGGDLAENIEKSIKYYEEALKVRTKADLPIDWALTQSNLGGAYLNRIGGDRAENLEKSIQCCNLALEVRKRADLPFDWSVTQNNLANAYSKRIRGERAENLEKSIKCYEEALEVRKRTDLPVEWASTQHNLGFAYQNSVRGDQIQNLSKAIDSYDRALTIFTSSDFPQDCRRTSGLVANLRASQGNWSQAVESYQNALNAAETLYLSCDFLYSKAAELEKTADIPRCAAYAYAKIGDLPAAVLAIETGRARGLSESLERDRANLQQLAIISPTLEARYQDITQQLRNLEVQQRQFQTSKELPGVISEDLRGTTIDLRAQLITVIEQIRQQPGYEDFLLPPTLEDILAATQPKQPLIYLVSTPNGSLALIVMSEEIVPVWVKDFTEDKLKTLAQSWFDVYASSNTSQSTWLEEIDRGTRELWQVMEPIIDQLQSHNIQQAILIPTGIFSLLPLHAAWKEEPTTVTKRHYALDSICFSYAPNARSLNECAVIANRLIPDQLLAIENPTQDLANSEREVQAVTNCFSQHQVLRKADASISSFRDALKQCNILHLACHGKTDLSTPLTSGLFMSDGRFTLKDLLELKLSTAKTGGIRLAVLSACETGLIGIENLDEVTSLPTGLLQAGVAGVIASLWSVSDHSTMALLVKFYELWHEQKLTFNEALRQSQIWLRDSTEGEIARLVGFRTRTPQDRPFIHPYHWSAFTYTGI
jgi:CHAT domain-containing protein/tetratricopeptide (TPR) repeat protein